MKKNNFIWKQFFFDTCNKNKFYLSFVKLMMPLLLYLILAEVILATQNTSVPLLAYKHQLIKTSSYSPG